MKRTFIQIRCLEIDELKDEIKIITLYDTKDLTSTDQLDRILETSYEMLDKLVETSNQIDERFKK